MEVEVGHDESERQGPRLGLQQAASLCCRATKVGQHLRRQEVCADDDIRLQLGDLAHKVEGEEALDQPVDVALGVALVGAVVGEAEEMLPRQRLRQLLEERLHLVAEQGGAAIHQVDESHVDCLGMAAAEGVLEGECRHLVPGAAHAGVDEGNARGSNDQRERQRFMW